MWRERGEEDRGDETRREETRIILYEERGDKEARRGDEEREGVIRRIRGVGNEGGD